MNQWNWHRPFFFANHQGVMTGDVITCDFMRSIIRRNKFIAVFFISDFITRINDFMCVRPQYFEKIILSIFTCGRNKGIDGLFRRGKNKLFPLP